MLQGKATVNKVGRDGVTIYLEKGLAKDSQFPFRVGEKVSVRIEGDTLVIRPSGWFDTLNGAQQKAINSLKSKCDSIYSSTIKNAKELHMKFRDENHAFRVYMEERGHRLLDDSSVIKKARDYKDWLEVQWYRNLNKLIEAGYLKKKRKSPFDQEG